MDWKKFWACMQHPNLLQYHSRVITEVKDLPQEVILVRHGALLVTNR